MWTNYVAIGAGLLGMVSFLLVAWSLWSGGRSRRRDAQLAPPPAAHHPAFPQAGFWAGQAGPPTAGVQPVSGEATAFVDMSAVDDASQRTAYVDMGELEDPSQRTAYLDMGELDDHSQRTAFVDINELDEQDELDEGPEYSQRTAFMAMDELEGPEHSQRTAFMAMDELEQDDLDQDEDEEDNQTLVLDEPGDSLSASAVAFVAEPLPSERTMILQDEGLVAEQREPSSTVLFGGPQSPAAATPAAPRFAPGPVPAAPPRFAPVPQAGPVPQAAPLPRPPAAGALGQRDARPQLTSNLDREAAARRAAAAVIPASAERAEIDEADFAGLEDDASEAELFEDEFEEDEDEGEFEEEGEDEFEDDEDEFDEAGEGEEEASGTVLVHQAELLEIISQARADLEEP